MPALITLLLILASLVTMVTSPAAWSFALVLIICFGLSYFFDAMTTMNAAFFIVYFVVWFVLSVKPLRRSILSAKFFKLFKKVLPPISKTEKDAIEAGTVWWDAQIFSGKPDLNLLTSLPSPSLTDEEKKFIDEDVSELCSMFTEWSTFVEKDLPPEAWQFIKDRGFLGMIIPKEFGGKGFSAYAHGLVVRKLASHCGCAVIHVMVPNSLGPGELLLHYGTDEQKNYYLPRLAKGLEIPAFALTSPYAGSDAASMTDFGIVCRGNWEGKEVLGMRLTWSKRYITLGPICTILGLAFKLYDPDHLLGDQEDLGITCALIPSNTPGINIGRRHMPTDAIFQNGPNSAKDLFVPLDFIIGGPSMVGQGWRMLMECLSAGRGISLPSAAIGSTLLALFTTSAYAMVRKQFRSPIAAFEGIQLPLARVAGRLYIMNAVFRLTAIALDAGEKPSVISAICKYHMTEFQRKNLIDAMDVQGGKAICSGPNNYVARANSQVPVAITVEGANILTRCLIIFGQGAIRCHPHVLKEMLLVYSDDPQALEKFDTTLFSHIAFAVRNTISSIWHGLTCSQFVLPSSSLANKSLKRYVKHFNHYCAAFSMVADFSMLLIGGNLKRKEALSSRLGDILSNLYMISAVMKNFQLDGYKEEDLVFVQWSLDYLFFEMQEAFYGFFENFPGTASGLVLKRIVFPWGRIFKMPADSLSFKLARLVTKDSRQRDSLFEDMFLSKDPKNPIAILGKAFKMIPAASEVDKKVRTVHCDSWMNIRERIEKAFELSVITSDEKDLYLLYLDLHDDVVNVDDFSQKLDLN